MAKQATNKQNDEQQERIERGYKIRQVTQIQPSWKAGEAKLSLAGSVVCSDAFFPFPDGLIAAAEAGATAAIQPGGSVKDAEVIAAADERGVVMVLSGVRHFRH